MPVPVYLAANCKEIATFTGRAAMLGLGFLPDGGARIPACPLQGHMAVIDDAVLPQRVPEETLDRLCGPVRRGVLSGFSAHARPRAPRRGAGPAAAARECPDAAARGLSRLCAGSAAGPLLPAALQCMGRLCPVGGAALPERALELTPWAAEFPAPPLPYPGGMLPAALCSCEKSPAGLRYFDTPESLRQKLAHAAAHGCRCAIGLWQELQPFFPERDG